MGETLGAGAAGAPVRRARGAAGPAPETDPRGARPVAARCRRVLEHSSFPESFGVRVQGEFELLAGRFESLGVGHQMLKSLPDRPPARRSVGLAAEVAPELCDRDERRPCVRITGQLGAQLAKSSCCQLLRGAASPSLGRMDRHRRVAHLTPCPTRRTVAAVANLDLLVRCHRPSGQTRHQVRRDVSLGVRVGDVESAVLIGTDHEAEVARSAGLDVVEDVSALIGNDDEAGVRRGLADRLARGTNGTLPCAGSRAGEGFARRSTRRVGDQAGRRVAPEGRLRARPSPRATRTAPRRIRGSASSMASTCCTLRRRRRRVAERRAR